MKWFILFAVITVCASEAPLNSGPYAPSGWRPSGAAFNLPTEYGAPAEEQARASEIEITNENVEYAGQAEDAAAISNPNTAYLPAAEAAGEDRRTTPAEDAEEDLLRVQGLPNSDFAAFNNNQLNAGEISPKAGNLRQAPAQQQQSFRNPAPSRQQQFRQAQSLPQKEAQSFQPQQQQFRGNLRQFQPAQQQFQQRQPQFQQRQQFRGNFKQAPQQQFRQAPQQQFRQAPQQQFRQATPQQQQNQFRPQQFSGQLKQERPFGNRQNEFAEFIPSQQQQQQPNNNRNVQQFGRQVEETPDSYAVPAREYGAPAREYGVPETPERAEQPEQPENEVSVGEIPQVEEQEEPERAESAEETDEPSVSVSNASSGQYYILAPDNTLQRVVFMTSKTEDDQRNNGFTAQLRYSPVAPIRDPIYAYNSQGQLMRLYN